MSEITKEHIDSLRELAETLSGKKLGNIKDPIKLQAIVDIARADKEENAEPKPLSQTAKQAKREAMRKEQMKLVRVNITAMSPFEKQLQGNFFDVGNSIVGNVRRYIPFGVDWHIEQIILETLKDKSYRTKREYKDPQTRKTVYENLFRKSFGIIELDSLTEEELKSHRQAMKAREYGDH